MIILENNEIFNGINELDSDNRESIIDYLDS